MLKRFIGTCVTNPFSSEEEICTVVNNGNRISTDKFCEACILDGLEKEIRENQKVYVCFEYKNVMFFHHNGVEYFYK